MTPVRRADNLITFMCQLSRNSGTSNSWNPKGLSRPVVGKLYLLLTTFLTLLELLTRLLASCLCGDEWERTTQNSFQERSQ
jgi:hypothetical protein